MYRFDSIEEYKKTFEEAYIKGLEQEVFNDFDSVAMLLMYIYVNRAIGYTEGIVDAHAAFKKSTPTMEEELRVSLVTIDTIVEVSTKKMEELGLL